MHVIAIKEKTAKEFQKEVELLVKDLKCDKEKTQTAQDRQVIANAKKLLQKKKPRKSAAAAESSSQSAVVLYDMLHMV